MCVAQRKGYSMKEGKKLKFFFSVKGTLKQRVYVRHIKHILNSIYSVEELARQA